MSDTPIWDEIVREKEKAGVLAHAITSCLGEADPKIWVEPLSHKVIAWLRSHNWTLSSL